MRQQFVVQILDDNEYDSLPYSKVRDSFGCADPENGLAFVRRTGIPEMDMGTLTHEVNHLLEKHNGEHDVDGIYYKSDSNFFSQIFGGGGLGGILGDVAAAALVPFTNGASLGFLPLLSAAGGAIQGGIQGGAGGILGGALKGFGVGGVGSALGGGLLGAGEGLASGGLSGAGSGLISGLGSGANTFISGIPGFGAGGTLSAATGLGGDTFGVPSLGTTGADALSPSSLSIPGQAAANAAAASAPGTTFATAPSVGSGLLGGATNAFNAATPSINEGIGGATGISGVPNFSLEGSPLAPPTAGLPSTTIDPLTGLPSTIAQQTPQAGAGITTALGNTATTGAAAAAPTAAKSVLGGINPLTLGAGLLGASALIPSPSFQMPPQIGALEQQIASGQAGTPVGQAAQNELQSIIQTPPSSLNPALAANDPYFASTFATMDQQNQQAIAALQASYQQSGQLGSGEYQDQLNQLLQSQADAKDQIVAQENQQRYLAGQQEQMTAIQQALGVDQNTMNNLVGLTGLSVEQAAAQYAVSAQDVQAIRNALGSVGASAITSGLGIKSPGINVTL